MANKRTYSDIALSFTPEAMYTGVPGQDVSRGMLYGAGKADFLSSMEAHYTSLEEKGREFDLSLAEQQRQYDESMDFSEELLDWQREQWEDQLGLYDDLGDFGDFNMGGPGSSFDFGPGTGRSPIFDTPPRIGPGSSGTSKYGGGYGGGGRPTDPAPGSWYDPGNVFDFPKQDQGVDPYLTF